PGRTQAGAPPHPLRHERDWHDRGHEIPQMRQPGWRGDQVLPSARRRGGVRHARALAQPWVMRYPLIDGQGNFGSVDGDPPAAMRYTECRLQPIANMLLDDLEKDTVDFIDNFDGEKKEPTVLPALLPQLLLNGSSGIAVGMATNIPPHNLGEVVDAVTFLIDNPDAELDKLFEFIKGPDFPTGGTIIGIEGVRLGYTTGHGRVVIRAKAHIEEVKADCFQTIVTELPYQVNKAQMIERIADLVRDKKIEGISDLRDESDREGMRIVFE